MALEWFNTFPDLTRSTGLTDANGDPIHFGDVVRTVDLVKRNMAEGYYVACSYTHYLVYARTEGGSLYGARWVGRRNGWPDGCMVHFDPSKVVPGRLCVVGPKFRSPWHEFKPPCISRYALVAALEARLHKRRELYSRKMLTIVRKWRELTYRPDSRVVEKKAKEFEDRQCSKDSECSCRWCLWETFWQDASSES
jgi:hypothetical protein